MLRDGTLDRQWRARRLAGPDGLTSVSVRHAFERFKAERNRAPDPATEALAGWQGSTEARPIYGPTFISRED